MESEEARQAAVSAEVAADMARIFGGMARRLAPATALQSGDAALPAAAKRHFGMAGIARMAAPLIVMIAIGIVAALVLMPTDMITAARTARPPAPRIAAARIVAAPTVTAPTIVAVTRAPPASPLPSPAVASPTADVPPVAVTARPAHASIDCADARDPDRCLYRQVRGADDRLRRAYRRAERAEVPYAEMVEVRRAWDRALEGSLDAPEATIRTYDRLALQLDRARLGSMADSE